MGELPGASIQGHRRVLPQSCRGWHSDQPPRHFASGSRMQRSVPAALVPPPGAPAPAAPPAEHIQGRDRRSRRRVPRPGSRDCSASPFMRFVEIDCYGRLAELRSVAPGRCETRFERTVVFPVHEYRSTPTQPASAPAPVGLCQANAHIAGSRLYE
jgi:hypothetical protein